MTNSADQKTLSAKLQTLREYFRTLKCAAVSFSGGVDSTLLLAVAHQEMGNNVIAVTETSALYPRSESDGAIKFCEQRGIHQIVVEHTIQEMEWTKTNPRERCYLCKRSLFADLRSHAEDYALKMGIIAERHELTYVEGSNMSDLDDFRPGAKAVKELGVASPLQIAGLTKPEVRQISRDLNLPTWNKASYACLASRFPYGAEITAELLQRAEAAEKILRSAGFEQCRVRMHEQGTLARIEVEPQRISDALNYMNDCGLVEFHTLGFKHVSLDLDGYRTGSMN